MLRSAIRCVSLLPQVSSGISRLNLSNRLSYTRSRYIHECNKFESRIFTEKMNFLRSDEAHMPTYRVLDAQGDVIVPSEDPQLGEETLVRIFKSMLTLNTMDTVLYNVQRQGLISFYMTNYGEEASHLGSAAAIESHDMIYGQYREAGVLLWRGFTLDQFMNQCCSNHLDLGKGRQMPVHYGSRELNFQTISSPLSTQIPQAAGLAYAQRYLLNQQDRITVCYFGDGAASEGDFHAALNFASTLESPVVFFVRNNGYAISTPTREQYRGDGIASRGPGYGIDTIRVDGNDVLAVYNVTKEARRRAIEECRPVLIEAITYRVGHHSTSDDSTRYRGSDEIDHWIKHDNPIARLRSYIEKRGWWNNSLEESHVAQVTKDVRIALSRAEKRKKPSIDELFTDVYEDIPKHLEEQKQQLQEHLKLYGDAYPLVDFHK